MQQQQLTTFLSELVSGVNTRRDALQDQTESELIHSVFDTVSVNYDEKLVRNVRSLMDFFIEKRKMTLDDLLKKVNMRLKSKYIDEIYQAEKMEAFDSSHSTITNVPMQQLAIPEDLTLERLLSASDYIPTPSTLAKIGFDALQGVIKDPTNYIFIDIGAGLGKAMLFAARLPFKKVWGVELSPFLAEGCKKNLVSYSGEKKCNELEIFCCNAIEFEFPNSNLVLYFWEPFVDQTFVSLLENVVRFIDKTGKQVVLMFLGLVPECVKSSDRFQQSVMVEPTNAVYTFESNPVTIYVSK